MIAGTQEANVPGIVWPKIAVPSEHFRRKVFTSWVDGPIRPFRPANRPVLAPSPEKTGPQRPQEALAGVVWTSKTWVVKALRCAKSCLTAKRYSDASPFADFKNLTTP